MSYTLPITLCLFTSTKGHWGSKTLYRATLSHLDHHCPLSLFGARLAHIKVTPGEESVATEMEADLVGRGFTIIKTVADWSRGTSHQHGILLDQRTVSQHPLFHSNRYMLLLEDDSPFVCHKKSVADMLGQSCQMLGTNHELVSVRTIRASDLSTSPMLPAPQGEECPNWFFSPHFNFQPAVLRTRDFYLAAQQIELAWDRVVNLQSELVWRIIFEGFSRRPAKHLVYHPSYAETYHLGVEDHALVAHNHGINL